MAIACDVNKQVNQKAETARLIKNMTQLYVVCRRQTLVSKTQTEGKRVERSAETKEICSVYSNISLNKLQPKCLPETKGTFYNNEKIHSLGRCYSCMSEHMYSTTNVQQIYALKYTPMILIKMGKFSTVIN